MPRPGRPTTNLDDAVKLYEGSDLGIVAVADRLNVPKRALLERLKERGTARDMRVANNLARNRGEVTRVLDAGIPAGDICDAYERGVSENELSKTYGLTRHRIGNVLKQAGVVRRSNGDANRLMVATRTPEENARNVKAAHEAVRGRRWTPAEYERHARTRHGQVTCEPYELLFAAWLRLRGIETVPQHALGPYNCDLAADPVAVEIFGGFWHAYGKHAETFAERSRYILDQGWNLVIVWVDVPRKRLAEPSADYIAAFIEQSRRDPTLRGEYRVIWGDGEGVPTAGRDLDEFAAIPPRHRRLNAR